MRNLKIIVFILSLTIFGACDLFDDDTSLDQNALGPNFAGFENPTKEYAAVADGNEYPFTVKVKVDGPTAKDLTADIEMTVEVDTTSTAIEGTHFRIDNPTVILKKSDNYLGLLDITMLTEGIITPLAESPYIILNVKSASGDGNVIANGKKIKIVLNYACFSDLAGFYNVVVTREDGSVGDPAVDEIVQIGVGQYKTIATVGLWGVLNPEFGLIFSDVCGKITVPKHDLADMYSNQIYGQLDAGNVDPETGVITINYIIEFDGGATQVGYSAVYTPVSK